MLSAFFSVASLLSIAARIDKEEDESHHKHGCRDVVHKRLERQTKIKTHLHRLTDMIGQTKYHGHQRRAGDGVYRIVVRVYKQWYAKEIASN